MSNIVLAPWAMLGQKNSMFTRVASVIFLFPMVFGEDHSLLAGRKHHAIVDALQLALLAHLFLDLG